MSSTQILEDRVAQEYKWGFVSDVEADTLPPGLNEDVVRAISARMNEPEWMLEWRLKAYRKWLEMKDQGEPTWPNVHYPPIDYQAASYFSAPKKKLDGMDEVDPEIR